MKIEVKQVSTKIGRQKLKVFAWWPKKLSYAGRIYFVWLEYYFREVDCVYNKWERNFNYFFIKEYPVFPETELINY